MPNDHKHQTALLLTQKSRWKHQKKASCKTFIKNNNGLWTAARGGGRGRIIEREDKREREDELKSDELFSA